MHGAKAMGCASAPWRSGSRAGALVLGLAIAASGWAAQDGASFAVTVDLRKGPSAGTCQTTPESPGESSVVSIDCGAKPPPPAVPVAAAPAARDARAFRFVIPNGEGNLRYGGVDLYAGTGTITSWRVVHLSDWDYLEMTVGW